MDDEKRLLNSDDYTLEELGALAERADTVESLRGIVIALIDKVSKLEADIAVDDAEDFNDMGDFEDDGDDDFESEHDSDLAPGQRESQ